MKKKMLSLLIVLTMLIGVLPLNVVAANNEIVILYTNDVHTYIEDEDIALSYDNVAAMKQDLQAQGKQVLLVDAGDHIQGTAYGAMDQGQTIIELMNAAKYDLATLGNHEFDYEMAGMFDAVNAANFDYVSCNFVNLQNNQSVFDGYKIFDCAGTKVAFVGITTPETITSSAPAYFQDGNGNFIYDVLGRQNENVLYQAVQTAVDAARNAGADYVIGLGHLGVDPSSVPWTSREVIAATTGMDAFIDGHSHTTIEGENVKNKAGKDVLLTQTGSYFANVGQMTISDSNIQTKLLSDYARADETVTNQLNAWVNTVESQLGEKIADSLIDFTVNDSDGKRMIRIRETNMGDFNADAYYYLLNEMEGLKCDVAIINGGGVRANADKGEWSYKTMKTVNPFGNIICLIEVSGQQILDALEWGARFTTGVADSPENGGLLHTAGLSYDVDTNITTTVQVQEGLWAGGPTGEYRVKNVKIYDKATGTYQPLDLKQKYTLAGANYTLRNMGDGFNMFQGATLIKDYIMEDYMALSAYAKAFKDTDGDGYGEITSANSPLASYKGYKINYENMQGSGRLVIKAFEKETVDTDNQATPVAPATADVAMPMMFVSVMAVAAVVVAAGCNHRKKYIEK